MEGSLQFESSRSTETMVPGDLITYDCRTMEASRRQVDTDQFRSWIDGIIRYDAISLPALLRRLAREYDVKIELCTDAFDDKTFRISITEAQDIESIMADQRQARHLRLPRRQPPPKNRTLKKLLSKQT